MLEALLRVVLEGFLELVCGTTGYLVLWVLTLGRRRSFEQGEAAGDHLAVLTGLPFWCAIGVTVWLVV